MLEKKIVCILFFLPLLIFAQYSEKAIDSLMLREVVRLRKDGKYEEILSLSNKVIENAKKIGYKKGEAWGYARLGNAYCTLGKYKESLKALDKAKQLSQDIADPNLKTSIAVETGRNYSESKISVKQAIEQFQAAVVFSKDIPDKYDRDGYLIYAYQSLASAYSNMNRNDLGIAYAWKSKGIEEDAYILSFLTYYHIKVSKNNDSILHYLNRSTAFLDKHPTYIFEKTFLYNQWGEYYENHKNYKKAVDAYKKAEIYGKESKAVDEVLKAFNGLSKSYEKLNDYEQTIKYERRFSRWQDSITNVRSKSISHTVDNIVRDKEAGFLERFSNMQKMLVIIFLIATVVISFLLIRVKRQQNQKKTIQELVDQKEEETQELKMKVNESFDEVIDLAKNNSPEFWGRFQEVYPDFREKLLNINPELKNTELVLSAYIYLGFNTKDIAEYTFKAIKTIKNNKYNLRKRLDIPTKDDFVVWIRNHTEKL